MSQRHRISPMVIVAIVGASLAFAGLMIGILVWVGIRLTSLPDEGGLGAERAEVVDDALRFRLRDPGHDWRLQDREEVQGLHPEARAGLIKLGGALTTVLAVEPAYGLDVASAAEVCAATPADEILESSEPRPIAIAGQRGLAFSRRAMLNGMEIHQRFAVFVHQDHIYQLTAWRITAPPDPADVQTAFAALEILPGAVVDRPPTRVRRDRHGPLWKLEGGVFTSAAHRLRVEEGGDWFPVVGAELGLVDLSAEVGLQRSVPPLIVLASGMPRPRADVEAERARLHDAFRARYEIEDGNPVTELPLTFEGRPVVFRRHRIERGFTFDYVHGVAEVDGWIVDLVAWSQAPGALDAHLADGLARLHVVPDAEARALEATNDHAWEDSISADSAARRGRFRSYAAGLSWSTPGPCWRAWTGRQALVREAEAGMVGECPRLGIRALWSTLPELAGMTPEALHGDAIDILFGTVSRGPSARVRVGSREGLHSDGTYTVSNVDHRYLIRTVDRDGQVEALAVYHPDLGPEAAAEADRALEAFSFDPVPTGAIESGPGRFADRRLGFAFADPASNATFEHHSTPGMEELMDVATTTLGNDVVSLIAIHLPDTDDESAAIDLMQESMLHRRGGDFLAQSRETTGTLGGLPCRVLDVSSGGNRQSMRLLRRGHTVYGMLVMAPRLSGTDLDEIARHWSWPDP
jgi:hypothetical protein